MPEQSPMRGWDGGGLSLERVRCDTWTVTPHRKRQSILHAEHPRRAPPEKFRRVHPKRGRKKSNDDQPKYDRERGEPYAEKIVPKEPQ